MATPHFPRKTLEKMQEKGISEADVLDNSTGRPVITRVWKRKII